MTSDKDGWNRAKSWLPQPLRCEMIEHQRDNFVDEYQLVYIIYIFTDSQTCNNHLFGLFVGQHFWGMLRELLCQGDGFLECIWKLTKQGRNSVLTKFRSVKPYSFIEFFVNTKNQTTSFWKSCGKAVGKLGSGRLGTAWGIIVNPALIYNMSRRGKGPKQSLTVNTINMGFSCNCSFPWLAYQKITWIFWRISIPSTKSAFWYPCMGVVGDLVGPCISSKAPNFSLSCLGNTIFL